MYDTHSANPPLFIGGGGGAGVGVGWDFWEIIESWQLKIFL